MADVTSLEMRLVYEVSVYIQICSGVAAPAASGFLAMIMMDISYRNLYDWKLLMRS